jgi:hypothetical protein
MSASLPFRYFLFGLNFIIHTLFILVDLRNAWLFSQNSSKKCLYPRLWNRLDHVWLSLLGPFGSTSITMGQTKFQCTYLPNTPTILFTGKKQMGFKIFTITLYKKTLFRFTMMDPLMKRMMKTKKSVENARELTLKLMPNLRLQFEVFTSTTENLRQSETSLSAWIYKRLSDFLVFFHFIGNCHRNLWKKF